MAQTGRQTKDERLLAALAAGLTVLEAAKQAEVSPRTAHRRLKLPAFRARLSELRAAILEQATDVLANLSAEAARHLGELMRCADSETVQYNAARSILELASKLMFERELEERIAALEARLGGKT